MKHTRFIVAVICCCATIFSLSAQHENLQTEVFDGQEFYIYKVQPSEGFYSLSKKFGVSQEEIIRYNPATKKGLKKGQIIKIPTPKKTEGNAVENTFEHTIVRGESLYSISKMYNVSIESIVALNPGSNKGIKAGAKLKIPQKQQKEESKTTAQSSTTKEPDNDSATKSSSHSADDNFIYYTIAQNETLHTVAQKYNTTVETILKLNPGLSPNDITAGEVIRLTPTTQEVESAVAEENSSYIQYQVGKKETLYSISKKFGITVDEIKTLNPGIRQIKQDDIIKIPANAEYNIRAEQTPDESMEEIDNIYNRLYVKLQTMGSTNVAVLLPFMLTQAKPNKAALEFTDFYQGFLLAVDSLKRDGASINVYAYDTEGKDEVVQSILARPEMPEMDLIIAPAQDTHFELVAKFGESNDVNVLNVFSTSNEEVNQNSRVFQANIPSSFFQTETIHRFTRLFQDYTVVFLSHPKGNKGEFVNEMKQELQQENIPFQEIQFDNELNLMTNNATAFANNSRIVFVPNSDNADILATIVTPLKELKEGRTDLDIALFGYPRWINFIPKYMDDFYALNTYFYSRFFANPSNKATKEFQKRYWYWYNQNLVFTQPTLAILGFDTGLYFLSAIQEGGKNFAFQDSAEITNGIQTDFKFERINNWSGFINKSFYFINFMPNNSIRKIRE